MNNITQNYYQRSNQSSELKALSMISSLWVSRLIYLGVKKNIFNVINKGFATVQQIQSETGIDASILSRVLHGYVHLDILQCKNHHYQLTSVGQLLTQDSENNFSDMALLWGEEFNHAWINILDSVESKRPGFDVHYDKNIFAYLGGTPTIAARFDRAMRSLAKYLYPAVASIVNIAPGETITDVGGGDGFLLGCLLSHHQNAKGILFDLPHVIERAQHNIPSPLQHHAVSYVKGDFFKSISHSDSHIMANILHDWDDEKAVTILKNVRHAKEKNTPLYLVEMLLDHQDEPHLARSTDLNMLMLTGGRERTKHEMETLLKQANFAIQSIHNVNQMTCVVRAIAV